MRPSRLQTRFTAGVILAHMWIAPTVASSAPILLISETDAEIAPLRARILVDEEVTVGSWTFSVGSISGSDVILSRCDPGPLNAVAATTLAINRFKPSLIITFGTARAHDPSLRRLDAVVATRFVPFDGLFSERLELGEGSSPATWSKLIHPMMSPGEVETRTESFPAAESIVALIDELESPQGNIVGGTIGSAYQVNRESDRVAWLRRTWQTDTEDFVSAHIAGCASLFHVSTTALRVIEAADETPDDKDPEAAALAASLVLQLLDLIAAPVTTT